MTPKLPKILQQKEVARTRIFCVEELHLEFSNGEQRIYERLKAGGTGAILVVPITADGQVLLIKEYAAGVNRYELALPKGLVEAGESPLEAANRELKEEVGFGADTLVTLKQVTLAPGYLSHQMTIVLAQDLYPEKLPGDEPEPIEVVPMPLAEIPALLARDDFTEARSLLALMLAEQYLTQKN
ncbi:MAG: ADP compounds hydrolase NudE [Gammaproteobacteria bacterium]|nr:ADP compounds hydrolase NudE [Gammaproteobacteria bacterium]NVK86804.1 ADP compounds hydrolase NudE [Gammaproteobacteria bacterium]